MNTERETCGNCDKRNEKGTCSINGKHMNPGLLAESCRYYDHISTYEQLKRKERK